MWIIKKRFRFEASHVLPLHDGKCKNLHGHSWMLTVECKGDRLLSGSKDGMLIDFSDISRIVKPIVDNFLDHKHLNDSLKIKNPTCENVSKWIFDIVKNDLPELYSVELSETESSSCEYREEI